MTRRELLRILGVAPLGAAAAGLGIEATPIWGPPPPITASEILARNAAKDAQTQVWADKALDAHWREVTLSARNLMIYGTSHPELGHPPLAVDWNAARPKVRSDLPPISWRTLDKALAEGCHILDPGKRREERREVERVGKSGREFTSPPLRGGDPPRDQKKSEDREEVGKTGVQPTPPGESAGGSPPGRASGRRRPE